ncbi:MAG: efflux RND transporter periplasmic adaptor subunit [Alphaproteobacteria bacterium]|nr:efflux RND transporter periplasmic adaptor subunit [Alphaproteobacteria bacterium]
MRTLKLALCMITFATSISAAALAQDKAESATPVVVTEVKRSSFADEVEALGTLKANESVDLASSVTELVTKISFEDNQTVKQGDILLEMDAAEELAELEEQKSFLNEAERQVNRLSPLVSKGAASASVLDESKRVAAGAKARVDATQARINQRIIKAPYDGVLGLRNISVGALAQPGSMITTIDDVTVMKLDFSVPEVFLSTLKPGVIIEATTQAYPEDVFKGEIANVDSRIDPVTRSIEARAIIDNADGKLKPGLLMHVVLQKNPRKALIIPEETLTANGADNYVLVVTTTDGKTSAERRKVELGARQFGSVEILSGLEEGEKIVTHGTMRVRPGAPLKITAVQKDNEPLKELLEQNNSDQKKAAQ